jgi:hypothetical protein
MKNHNGGAMKGIQKNKSGACMVIGCERPVAYVNPTTRRQGGVPRGYCVAHKAMATTSENYGDFDADAYEKTISNHAKDPWRIVVDES